MEREEIGHFGCLKVPRPGYQILPVCAGQIILHHGVSRTRTPPLLSCGTIGINKFHTPLVFPIFLKIRPGLGIPIVGSNAAGWFLFPMISSLSIHNTKIYEEIGSPYTSQWSKSLKITYHYRSPSRYVGDVIQAIKRRRSKTILVSFVSLASTPVLKKSLTMLQTASPTIFYIILLILCNFSSSIILNNPMRVMVHKVRHYITYEMTLEAVSYIASS